MRSIWPVVETFRREQWSTETLLAPFGLAEAEIEDENRRIAQDVVADIWDLGATLSRDPSFGLRALQSLSRRRRSLVDYVLLNSPSLGAMIERGIRYERLWQEGREASLERRGTLAVLRWSTRPGLRFSPALSEFALAMVVLLARAATCSELGCDARFPHGAPPDVERYEALFAGSVRFSAGELALLFPAERLETPLAHADSALLSVLETHAHATLEQLPPVRSVAQAVRQALSASLIDGAATLDEVSQRLQMSSRTLRRRLADEGVNYQDLVDELRSELAMRYLGDRRVSITEVAFLVGFADTAAFSKAFRRWTGQSPSVARKRALGA